MSWSNISSSNGSGAYVSDSATDCSHGSGRLVNHSSFSSFHNNGFSPRSLSKYWIVFIFAVQSSPLHTTPSYTGYLPLRASSMNSRLMFPSRSPSVDRLVPEQGYVESNVALCRHQCNTIKNDATLDELRLLTETLSALLAKLPQ